MIFIVYTIVMALLTIMLLGTIGYKKRLFDGLEKKEHPCRILYGSAAFLTDFIHYHIHQVNYESVRSKLSRLKADTVRYEEAYVHVISGVALSLLTFIVVAAAGYVRCLNGVWGKEKKIVSLNRPSVGEEETVYTLTMVHGQEEEVVHFTIPGQEMSQEQAEKIFEEHYPELIRVMLGDNKDCLHVTENLNLVYELSDGIEVMWEKEDALIEDSGKIIRENLKETEEEILLQATMMLGKYEKGYEIPLVLVRKESDLAKKVEESVQELIRCLPETEQDICLDTIREKYQVEFYFPKESTGLGILLLAGGMAVIIWFACRRDTDQALIKRQQQLQADYAEIVSKLTVLQSAGMTTLAAFDKIIEDYERQRTSFKENHQTAHWWQFNRLKICCKLKCEACRDTNTETYRQEKRRRKIKMRHANNLAGNTTKRYAYEEMKYARQLMQKGYAETEAYLEFGRRCGNHLYIKLANLLEQNMKKGTKGLSDILKAEVTEAFEERKALARKKGDEAGTKLLLPMGLMLIISIVMIIVPALLAFGL